VSPQNQRGGARPRYVVECFFFSAELETAVAALSHSHCQVGLARVGIDEKIYSFLVLFWQQRVLLGGDALSLCRVRRDTAFACDLIMHKHTTSATCLPSVYVHPPSILPGGAGERE
jgi:hypothetical protein